MKLASAYQSLLLAAVCSVTMVNAWAGVTYDYTGLPFASGIDAGRHVEASVTFVDGVVGLTGIATATSVESWSIEVSGLPATPIDSSTGFTLSGWPLWFKFSAGAIIDWQMLSAPQAAANSTEIYTTKGAPYGGILTTADVYRIGTALQGTLSSAPGTWTAAAVPEAPSHLLLLAGLCAVGASAARRSRIAEQRAV